MFLILLFLIASADKTKRLLDLFSSTYNPALPEPVLSASSTRKRTAAARGGEEDFDYVGSSAMDAFDTDIQYFRASVLTDIRKNIGTKDQKVYKYFGGVDRAEDIDIFEFYAKHMQRMPVAGPVITEMLSQPAASSSPESLFSHGRFIVNDYRTSTLPKRAEKLILSSAWFKSKLVSKALPHLPDTGVDDDSGDLDSSFEARAAQQLATEREVAEEYEYDSTTDVTGFDPDAAADADDLSVGDDWDK